MRRFLAAIIMVGAVAALVKLLPAFLANQTATTDGSTAESNASSPSETSWGEPDLQGIWTSDFEVPLQRPSQYAGKEVFTEEERAQLDQLRTDILSRDTAESRRKRGTEHDVGGAYNATIFMTHKHVGRRTSLIADPPDGRIPPYTPEALEKMEALRQFQLALLQPTDACKNNLGGCRGGKYGPPSPRRNEVPPIYLTTGAAGGAGGGSGGGVINRSDGPEDRTLSERCLGAALPDFGGNAGFFLQIVQSPGSVSMFYDTGQGQGWPRVIPVTDRPHLPSHVRQWWGDSRGRWEGDTLVVDVTNFSPKSFFQGSYDNLHLVERWTRRDANTIEYAVVIEDPTVWKKPWTVRQEYQKQDDRGNRVYREPRCHEGNYGMVALLAGAHAAERAFAAGRGPDPATVCTGGCGGFAAGFADEGEDSNPLSR